MAMIWSGVVWCLVCLFVCVSVNNDNRVFAGIHDGIRYITCYYSILLQLSFMGFTIGVDY